LQAHEGWNLYVQEYLHPQQDLENPYSWECGRPTVQALNGMDSDGDDFLVRAGGGGRRREREKERQGEEGGGSVHLFSSPPTLAPVVVLLAA
jgi:hypothetical protein